MTTFGFSATLSFTLSLPAHSWHLGVYKISSMVGRASTLLFRQV